MNGGDLELPPGFRFHPTDEELVTHYLCRKCSSLPISVPIITEIDLYKLDPWDLPGMALYGEKEWYFFSPRERKYPNGSRPNRAAGSGYWKATGADKPIGNPKPIAIKKALVFYAGRAPRGVKTNWIMHEYRLADVDRSARKKIGLRLDDWVLCRIYNKKGRIEKLISQDHDQKIKPLIHQSSVMSSSVSDDRKPEIGVASLRPPSTIDVHYAATSTESVPRLLTDSSCSGHVGSTEVTCEKEVQSQPKWRDWSELGLDMRGGSMDGIANINTSNYPFNAQYDESNNSTCTQYFSPLQDMFMYLHKPF